MFYHPAKEQPVLSLPKHCVCPSAFLFFLFLSKINKVKIKGRSSGRACSTSHDVKLRHHSKCWIAQLFLRCSVDAIIIWQQMLFLASAVKWDEVRAQNYSKSKNI